MTRALTRTNFHSSKLIRVLSDLAMLEAAGPGVAFAEKLGLWLNLHDAINLCSAHNASAPVASSGGKPVASGAIGDEFARIQAALVNSITQSGVSSAGRSRMALPSPKPGDTLEEAGAYEPYRRYYLAHQRDMELRVRPLRAHVRDVLAKASPALRQLAALDAVFDGVLGDRESKVLSTIPSLLDRRFGQLRKAHQQKLVDAQQEDNPAFWVKTGGWLARFCHEMQTVLLAELDVRLLPTLGLIEAFNNEMTKHK
jgi:hypothetical protein